VAEKTVESARQTSMDQGAIKELLESDAFVTAMRKNLGLKEQNIKVCDFCETETQIRQVKDQEGNARAVHYCETCKEAKKDPLIKTRWIERDYSLMHKQGVEMFITNIRGSADKIHFTSNFTSSEISKIMENFHRKVADELYENWNDYGIKKYSSARKIAAITTNLVWAGYNRALDGKTLEGVVNMGDDRTVKKSSTPEKNSWTDRIGLGD